MFNTLIQDYRLIETKNCSKTLFFCLIVSLKAMRGVLYTVYQSDAAISFDTWDVLDRETGRLS